jgi:hypothetical protein
MRPELRRLAALAAALAPGAAERLVLLVAEDSASAAALAAALARGGREARVDAVAAAFADPDSPSQTTTDATAHPLLRRLAREERAGARRR